MDATRLPLPVRRVLEYRRRGRVRFVLSKVNSRPGMKIIDIGCGIDGRTFEDHIPRDWAVTGVDILPPERIRHTHPCFCYLLQDARNLSRFGDGEFDLAVSIGMLEHITGERESGRIVSEIRRVARQHIVIVPYRYCWIEPHYGVPFFPLLPYPAKVALVKSLNLCGHRELLARDPQYIHREFVWKSNAEYRRIFPDARIYLLPTLETIAIIRKAQL